MKSEINKEFGLKDGRKLLIREAKESDAESLLECTKDVFTDDRYFLTTSAEAQDWMTVEKSSEQIGRYLDNSDNLMLIALMDGVVIGQINIDNYQKQRLKHVGSFGISIRPEYRGLGAGSKLIKTAIEWARNHETVEKLALSVHATNEVGISLYEKMGFVEEGRKVKELKLGDGRYVDSVMMYLHV